jgi:hypothetical protein
MRRLKERLDPTRTRHEIAITWTMEERKTIENDGA